ncbi:MAG: EF-hand domain-containing protein [Pseudomonadota bacterium]|nr:EF-hand domain-containing protein [Pseudomonadota bacterium]
MRFSKSLVPGVALLCGSGLAMAEEHMDRPQEPAGAIPEFSAVDADKNGVISSSEAVAVPALVEQFSEADRNADGKLTKDEYAVIENSGEDKPSEGRI